MMAEETSAYLGRLGNGAVKAAMAKLLEIFTH